MTGRTAAAGRRRRSPAARGPAPDETARLEVVRALGPRARDPSEDVRQAVAAVLGEVGGPSAVRALAPLLADASDRVRRAAVFGLARASGSSTREMARLRRYLRDPAPRVRAAAAVVLGRRRDRGSVPALLDRLAAPGTWEKPSVAVALGRIGDRRAVGPLIELARSPARWLRVCALHALGEIGAAEGRPSVRMGLHDPAWSVRGAAAIALGHVGTPRDVPQLLATADDPHPWPRRGALYALGRLHRRDAAARLRAGLRDPAAEVRVAACWALGELGDPSARGPLARLLPDCPVPSDPRAGPMAPTEAGPPVGEAEGRLLEAVVSALARLPAPAPDAEVDRALDAAERRLAPEALERASRPPFPDAGATEPPPTLRRLFAAARSLPDGAGR